MRHTGDQVQQLTGNEILIFGTNEGVNIISLHGRDRDIVFGALLNMRAYTNSEGHVIFAKSLLPVRFNADSPPSPGTPFSYELARLEETGPWDKYEILLTKQLVYDMPSDSPVWSEV